MKGTQLSVPVLLNTVHGCTRNPHHVGPGGQTDLFKPFINVEKSYFGQFSQILMQDLSRSQVKSRRHVLLRCD